ncbi:MAG: apolipoprotein N-acyltransferase [Gammaproteobacteria bacterium]|nr:MAG: apolipoprotein N-acyltransferase [Gammaproteobacteria bacterium]
MKKNILLIILGLIWVLGFAPFELWIFPILSLAGFFYLIQESIFEQKPKKLIFLQGWLYGVGLFFGGVHWIYISIAEFGKGGPIAGVFVTIFFICVLALYPAVFALIAQQFARIRNNPKTVLILALPALWVIVEWLRGWLFTGFPWLLMGNAFVDMPLSSFAPVFGVFALSYIAALFSGVIACVLLERANWRQNRTILSLGVLALLFVAVSLLLKRVEWTEKSGEPLKVAMVQGNIKQDIKWDPSFRQYTLDKYFALTQELLGKHDVVVWPETAIPDFLHYVDDYMLSLQAQVNVTGTAIVTGVPVYDYRNKRYFNSMIAIDRQQLSYYAKRHLVIFGEYLPFRNIFGESLDFLGAAMADFTSGEERQKPLITKEHKAAASICFEIVFGNEIANELGDADYMINISNDAWFEGSIAPYQHLQIAQMRALETGRPLVRSTNTGISAMTDHQGKLLIRSPQYEEYVLTGVIQPRKGQTPYVKWGNIPILVLTLFLIIISLIMSQKEK